jgi:uncharacterized membrane protein SirB2
MLADCRLLQAKLTKIIPHVVDATLLGSALVLLYGSSWTVTEHRWLQVKIAALLVYIALGVLALKPGRVKALRFWAWLCGLMVFGFIVSVALTKSALGFMVWFL